MIKIDPDDYDDTDVPSAFAVAVVVVTMSPWGRGGSSPVAFFSPSLPGPQKITNISPTVHASQICTALPMFKAIQHTSLVLNDAVQNTGFKHKCIGHKCIGLGSRNKVLGMGRLPHPHISTHFEIHKKSRFSLGALFSRKA